MLRSWIAFLFAVPLLAAPVPKDATPAKQGPNTNALLKAQAGKFTVDASSTFGGWEPGKLVDGNVETSWFSASGDAPMNGKQPWVRIAFESDVTVRRVTVLGNREPQYPTGYFVLTGTIELVDDRGEVLQKIDMKAEGEKKDFDWDVGYAKRNVRAIRFTATGDEKQFNCIGLAELQVE